MTPVLRWLLPSLLSACTLCFASTVHAQALRCGSSVVREGDRAFDVLRKCGQPTFSDGWDEHLLYGVDIVAHVEDWYYNYGPSRLVQVMHFRNSRLNSIESAGYGFLIPGGRCDPGDIGFGLSEFELAVRCGQPDARERRYEFRSERIGSDFSYPASVRVDEWVYNFGPNQFIRYVTLVDGRVDKVEIGDRGY